MILQGMCKLHDVMYIYTYANSTVCLGLSNVGSWSKVLPSSPLLGNPPLRKFAPKKSGAKKEWEEEEEEEESSGEDLSTEEESHKKGV